MPNYLKEVLEINLPKASKKSTITLGCSEKILAGAIKSTFDGVNCLTADTSDIVAELLRGIRVHAEKLIDGLNPGDIEQAGRGLGHAYSRGRIMFDPKRSDRSIIEAIKVVDMEDKSNNTHYMRLREWYGWHFPELSKIEPDNYTYGQLVKVIGDKSTLNDDRLHEIAAIVSEDGEKAQAIIDAAKVSMGMAVSLDCLKTMAGLPVNKAYLTRKQTAANLEKNLNTVAPNLQMLVGTMVAARLIEAAQGLGNLAKMPASTLQILGAEKALFRALKAKSNTPKYGLIFHSTFIGRASTRDKGRISRYLANKCSIACRIDFFAEEPSTRWGQALKQQVEDRLEFYATGKRPAKNADVMVSRMIPFALRMLTTTRPVLDFSTVLTLVPTWKRTLTWRTLTLPNPRRRRRRRRKRRRTRKRRRRRSARGTPRSPPSTATTARRRRRRRSPSHLTMLKPLVS